MCRETSPLRPNASNDGAFNRPHFVIRRPRLYRRSHLLINLLMTRTSVVLACSCAPLGKNPLKLAAFLSFTRPNKGYQSSASRDRGRETAARFIVGLFGEFACIVHRRGTEISYRPDGCCPLSATPLPTLCRLPASVLFPIRTVISPWTVFSHRKRLAKPTPSLFPFARPIRLISTLHSPRSIDVYESCNR